MVQHESSAHLADIKTLQANLNPDVPIFLLIDPIVGEPLSSAAGSDTQEAREALWQRPVIGIQLSSRTPLQLHQHPYIVTLEGIDDPLLELTLEIAQAERLESQADGLDGEGTAVHRVGGWLQTSQSTEELASQLSTMFKITLNTTTATKASYLRLPDRRTLSLLQYVIGDARVSTALGHIQRWAYLDVQGKFATLKGSASDAVALRFDHSEWAQMQQGNVLHPALALCLGEMARHGKTQMNTQPVQALYKALFSACQRAQKAAKIYPHRFQLPIDRSIWAALCLLHPAAETSHAVAQLLKDTGTEHEPAQPLRYIQHQVKACITTRPSEFALATH